MIKHLNHIPWQWSILDIFGQIFPFKYYFVIQIMLLRIRITFINVHAFWLDRSHVCNFLYTMTFIKKRIKVFKIAIKYYLWYFQNELRCLKYQMTFTATQYRWNSGPSNDLHHLFVATISDVYPSLPDLQNLRETGKASRWRTNKLKWIG